MDEKRKSLFGLHAANILFCRHGAFFEAYPASSHRYHGAALAWMVLGEAPTLTTVLGGFVIVGAAAFESCRA